MGQLTFLSEAPPARISPSPASELDWQATVATSRLSFSALLIAHGLDAEHLHPTDANTRYPDIPRDAAIKEWLARHDEVEDWCAIDDCLCADEAHMVLIDPDAGLHVGHLYTACRMLGAQAPVFLL